MRIRSISPLIVFVVFGLVALLLIAIGAPSTASALTRPAGADAIRVQVTQAWLAQHAGMRGVAVVADAAGGTYVTGPSLQDAVHNFREDIVTIKYDSGGNEVWVREFDEADDATNGSDVPTSMTLDPSGNILIAGRSFLNSSGENFITLKYDPNGNLLWKARYAGGFEPARIGSDAAGNVYVTGRSAGTSSANYVTVKYNANGSLQWARTYNGPANFKDQASSLAVSPDGKVAVTGISSGGATLDDIATILYDTNGNQLWVRRYDAASGGDSGNDVALGPAGEVYVGGYSVLSGLTDMLLIKYDAAGNQAWVQRYDGPDAKSDSVKRIRVDSLGNIIVTGYSQSASFFSDFATLKYSASGSLIWVRLYDGPIANDEDIPWAMTLGADDAVYVTGGEEGDKRIATVKYDANGNLQWTATFDNAGTLLDRGQAIALDAAGRVVVTGQSPILTIAYDQGGPAPTPTPAPTATPTPGSCVSNCLRSSRILLQATATGVRGRVTVTNESGAAVAGATVSVSWTLPNSTTVTQSAVTTSTGAANFSVTGGAGTYTLTVTNITKAGSTFDPVNSVLSRSLTK